MGRRKAKKTGSTRPTEAPDDSAAPSPFWSGVIAFGLVSLPVVLFPANRGKSLALKMMDRDGTPLRRRYMCDKESKILAADELARGYEVAKGRFITVEDEELEALAPEKSREIDLSRFVPLSQINPIYFERGYFLAPDSDTTKAYRLLAHSMEASERAGIATFVMRGKEYLVAIIAEGGILRAQTLRFSEEIRLPTDVGLPALHKPPPERVTSMRKAIDNLSDIELKDELLKNKDAKKVMERIDEKLEKGQDVILAPAQVPTTEEPEDNVIDIMDVLQARLRGETGERTPSSSSGRPGRTQSRPGENSESLNELTKDELYRRAAQRNVAGRSRMSKRELLRALQ